MRPFVYFLSIMFNGEPISIDFGRKVMAYRRRCRREAMGSPVFTSRQIEELERQFKRLQEKGLVSRAKVVPVPEDKAGFVMDGTVNGRPFNLVFYKFGNLEDDSYRGLINGEEVIRGPYFLITLCRLATIAGETVTAAPYTNPKRAPVVEL